MSRTPNTQAGFTLIELMIVVAIIGLMAGAFMPTLFNQVEKAEQARIAHDLKQLSSQLKFYNLDKRSYPNNNKGLVLLVPEYLDTLPTDPYGNPYLYKRKGQDVAVYTLGADASVGGTGSDTDISKVVSRKKAARPTATPNDDDFNPFEI